MAKRRNRGPVTEHAHQHKSTVKRTPDGIRRPWKDWQFVWRGLARGKRKPIVKVIK